MCAKEEENQRILFLSIFLMGLALTILGVGIMGFCNVIPEHVWIGLVTGIIGVILCAPIAWPQR